MKKTVFLIVLLPGAEVNIAERNYEEIIRFRGEREKNAGVEVTL